MNTTLTIYNLFSINCCCNTALEFCSDTVSIVGTVCGIFRLQTDGLNKSWRGKLIFAKRVTTSIVIGLLEQLDKMKINILQ